MSPLDAAADQPAANVIAGGRYRQASVDVGSRKPVVADPAAARLGLEQRTGASCRHGTRGSLAIQRVVRRAALISLRRPSRLICWRNGSVAARRFSRSSSPMNSLAPLVIAGRRNATPVARSNARCGYEARPRAAATRLRNRLPGPPTCSSHLSISPHPSDNHDLLDIAQHDGAAGDGRRLGR